MNTTILGFRFLLGTVSGDPQDSSIGLYSNPTTHQSELRWAEEPLVVPGSPSWSPTAWHPGVIADDGIGDIEQSQDFKLGGEAADYSGLDINTTAAARALASLATHTDPAGNPVTVAGKSCEVWEFLGTDTDSGSASAGPVFCGVVAIPERKDVDYKISAKSASYMLTAQIGVIINNGNYTSVSGIEQAITSGQLTANYPYASDSENGKIVPATLGELPYDGNLTGAPAKLLRTASAIVPLTINGTVVDTDGHYRTILSHVDTSGNPKLQGSTPVLYDIQYALDYGTAAPDYGDIEEYPVLYAALIGINYLTYTIRAASASAQLWQRTYNGSSWSSWSNHSASGAVYLSYLAGKYMTAVDGTQSGNGRLIGWATYTTINQGQITITLADYNYFTADNGDPAPLQANSTTAPVTGDTWCQIQDKHQDYAADEWPGAGWL